MIWKFNFAYYASVLLHRAISTHSFYLYRWVGCCCQFSLQQHPLKILIVYLNIKKGILSFSVWNWGNEEFYTSIRDWFEWEADRVHEDYTHNIQSTKDMCSVMWMLMVSVKLVFALNPGIETVSVPHILDSRTFRVSKSYNCWTST